MGNMKINYFECKMQKVVSADFNNDYKQTVYRYNMVKYYNMQSQIRINKAIITASKSKKYQL